MFPDDGSRKNRIPGRSRPIFRIVRRYLSIDGVFARASSIILKGTEFLTRAYVFLYWHGIDLES